MQCAAVCLNIRVKKELFLRSSDLSFRTREDSQRRRRLKADDSDTLSTSLTIKLNDSVSVLRPSSDYLNPWVITWWRSEHWNIVVKWSEKCAGVFFSYLLKQEMSNQGVKIFKMNVLMTAHNDLHLKLKSLSQFEDHGSNLSFLRGICWWDENVTVSSHQKLTINNQIWNLL